MHRVFVERLLVLLVPVWCVTRLPARALQERAQMLTVQLQTLRHASVEMWTAWERLVCTVMVLRIFVQLEHLVRSLMVPVRTQMHASVEMKFVLPPLV